MAFPALDALRAGYEVYPVVDLQRDWAREETVEDVIQIVLTKRLLKA
jgi:hypothetical protein